MNIEKVNHPVVTIGTMVTFVFSLGGIFMYEVGKAADMAVVQTEIQAIQETQRVESNHQKERHEAIRDEQHEIKDQIQETNKLLQQLIIKGN